jgi:hypothetical protein
MLEIVAVSDEGRKGEAYLDYDSAYQGYVTYIKGVNAAGDVVLGCPYNSAQAIKCYYPVKKLKFEEDLSDTSEAVDRIRFHTRVVYYEGGEFWTDRFARDSLSFGRALPAATAYNRGGYGVDVVVHTVAPTVPLYVEQGTVATRGRLTALQTATVGAAGQKAFRLVEAWGATAANVGGLETGTQLKVRFKVVPGYVGQQF